MQTIRQNTARCGQACCQSAPTSLLLATTMGVSSATRDISSASRDATFAKLADKNLGEPFDSEEQIKSVQPISRQGNR